MNDHFLNASFALSSLEKERQQLERDNAQLINGTAKQAATLRTQQQRISDLEAEVTIEKYNVEFVKHQGRKTRFINRNKLRGLKDKITSLARKLTDMEGKARRIENANQILRQQMSSLIESHTKLQRDYEAAVMGNGVSVMRSYEPEVSISRDRYDYTIAFDSAHFRARYTYLEIEQLGPNGIRVLADVTASQVVKGVREKVVSTILDYFNIPAETPVNKAKHSMRGF